MSETTETVTDATEAATAEVPAETAEPDHAAEAEKWKALARKNEQRAKDNADKAKRFDEFEEANKSDLEKLLARAEAAEKAVVDASAKALRAEVAASKGVPLELLSGSTQEDLEASADRLLAFKGTTPKAASVDGAGNVGDTISGAKQITSREQLKTMSSKEIVAAQKSGQLRDLLSGK